MSLLNFQINYAYLEHYHTKSANLLIKEKVDGNTFPILITFNRDASISFHFFPPKKATKAIKTAFVVVYLYKYSKTEGLFKPKKKFGWGIFSPSHPIVVTFQMKKFTKLDDQHFDSKGKLLTCRLKVKQFQNNFKFLFPDDELFSAILKDTDFNLNEEDENNNKTDKNVFWTLIKGFGRLYLRNKKINIFGKDFEKCYQNYFSNSSISTLSDFFFCFASYAEGNFNMNHFFENNVIDLDSVRKFVKKNIIISKDVSVEVKNDNVVDDKKVITISNKNNENKKIKFETINKFSNDLEILVDETILSENNNNLFIEAFYYAHVISIEKGVTINFDLSDQLLENSQERTLYDFIDDNIGTDANTNEEEEKVGDNDNVEYEELIKFDKSISSEIEQIVPLEKRNNLFALVKDKIPAINFNAFPFQFDLEKTLFISFDPELSPTIEIKEEPFKEGDNNNNNEIEMNLTMYDFTGREERSFILEENEKQFIIFNPLFKDMPEKLFYKIELGNQKIKDISNIFIFWKYKQVPAGLIYLDELPTFKFNVDSNLENFQLVSKRLYSFYIYDEDYEISIEICTAAKIDKIAGNILH